MTKAFLITKNGVRREVEIISGAVPPPAIYVPELPPPPLEEGIKPVKVIKFIYTYSMPMPVPMPVYVEACVC